MPYASKKSIKRAVRSGLVNTKKVGKSYKVIEKAKKPKGPRRI